MNSVRQTANQLQGLTPYDPKYLPAQVMISANENPRDIPKPVRLKIMERIAEQPFHRYPDPLANDLRDVIAEANGLQRENVLVSNGGDELLFGMALAWGGPGRTFLNMPPTFSVYAANARLTNTAVVDVPRREDFSIDEEAVLERVAQGDIDFMVVPSPNNPTGGVVDQNFLLRLLEATDALVMVDEAYSEFSCCTTLPLLKKHKNLIILHTFSKAYSLAGVRMGYILAHPEVISEFLKVRQPYSVDTVSQIIARTVYENRELFKPGIDEIVAERRRVFEELRKMVGVTPYPSQANYILFNVDCADEVWTKLYERGVLIRDFSHAPYMEDCLRVSIGTREENDVFLKNLEEIVTKDLEFRHTDPR